MRPAPVSNGGGSFDKISNIVIGLVSIGVSFLLLIAFLDLQSDYEQYCTGFVGFLVEVFSEGQCSELENYMFFTGAGSLVCGLLGFVFLILGLASSSNARGQVVMVPQYIQQPQQFVQQPPQFVQQPQQFVQQPPQFVQQPQQHPQRHLKIDKTQSVHSNSEKPKSGLAILFLSILITITLIIALSVWDNSLSNDEDLDPEGDFDNDGIINSIDSDDDNDGFEDTNDWFDKGNGGIEISFSKFQVWDNGNYDSGGGLPDVYAYVGIGNSNCGDMQYFPYLDDINPDSSTLYDWKTFVYDFEEDATSVCIEVTVYDEDSWAPDEILDFIPGTGNYYQHSIDLSSGEGNQIISHDNRGENALSIELEYSLKRITINS
ncbi:hypothetical protein OAT73_06730 [Candidatus Poseidoniaceae archaeon]|nr:hypothetical protein [Candidatus Poseidoniaceae archaeon]